MTIDLNKLILPGNIFSSLKATSKKKVFLELAARAAHITDLAECHIFEVLIEREQLGTTGVGNGIAIPHGKLPGLDRLCGFFARMDQPVDFDSIDGQPVDLVFLLLAPESAGADHLRALAKVSRMLRDGGMCEKLRGSRNPDALYALLTDSATPHTA
jgi:PTS system nitrogen regulatory IIA component